MGTEAQKRAKAKYSRKLNTITITFYPKESALFDHLQKQENKQGYIKELIRKDIRKNESQ